MLEPSKSVTLKARYTPYPAVALQSDKGRVLRPGSVILRHHHLKQQFTIVPSTSRQRLPAFAPPQRPYQLAPTSAAVHPAVALPAGVAPGAASIHPSPAAACSSRASAATIPPVAGSSVIAPTVLPAPVSITPSVAVRAGDAGSAVPSTANPAGIAAAKIPPTIHGMSSGKGTDISPAQPLPMQAMHRNTSRGHEIVESSDSSLVVKCAQRAIRDKKGQTTWFYSSGQTYLLEPPILERAQLGDLYVHTTANCDQQIWIFKGNSQWERIQLYHPHPVLSGYVLHRVSDGEPRWVHKTTVTTYKGREKRYRQMCSQLEAEAPPVTSSGQAARLADAP